MKPQIIVDDKYITVKGHYDDKVLCAKLTLLCQLYGAEYLEEGYARIPYNRYFLDDLKLIDDKLLFGSSSYYLTIKVDGTTVISGQSVGSSSVTVSGSVTESTVVFTNYGTYTISDANNYKITSVANGYNSATYTTGNTFSFSVSISKNSTTTVNFTTTQVLKGFDMYVPNRVKKIFIGSTEVTEVFLGSTQL